MEKKLIESYIAAGDDVYQKRVDRDIEQNRKGDFQLILLDSDGNRISNAFVSAKMMNIDFCFGANIFMLGEYHNPERNLQYQKEYTAIFNSATVPLYWEGTEPKEGYLRYHENTPHDVYRRPPAEEVMKFCENHGLRMKGHPLFWHEYVPDWLPDCYSELKPHIVRRFREIADICGDRIEMFDVVNEPSRIYDVYMRNRDRGVKYLIPDDNYCEELFRLAKQCFPSAKLILNDVTGAVFNEFRGKYSGYYLLIKDLLSRGTPIDEIGFQCHIDSDCQSAYNTERLYDILDTYATLGKTINISEISIPSLFDGEESEDLQAIAAERLYKTCFSHKAITGITWWNLPDDGIYTGKRKAKGENMPSTGLIGTDYHEKLAYKKLKKLITKEWQTDFSGKASSDGIIRFRGYYGKYKIVIAHDNTTREIDIALNSNMPTIRTLRI